MARCSFVHPESQRTPSIMMPACFPKAANALPHLHPRDSAHRTTSKLLTMNQQCSSFASNFTPLGFYIATTERRVPLARGTMVSQAHTCYRRQRCQTLIREGFVSIPGHERWRPRSAGARSNHWLGDNHLSSFEDATSAAALLRRAVCFFAFASPALAGSGMFLASIASSSPRVR